MHLTFELDTDTYFEHETKLCSACNESGLPARSQFCYTCGSQNLISTRTTKEPFVMVLPNLIAHRDHICEYESIYFIHGRAYLIFRVQGHHMKALLDRLSSARTFVEKFTGLPTSFDLFHVQSDDAEYDKVIFSDAGCCIVY